MQIISKAAQGIPILGNKLFNYNTDSGHMLSVFFFVLGTYSVLCIQ